MIRLILKRILVAIPVMILISLVTFYLKGILTTSVNQSDIEQTQRPTRFTPHSTDELKPSAPSFYFSILPLNFPDTLYQITDEKLRFRATRFLKQGVRWKSLQEYLLAENQLFVHDFSGYPAIYQTASLNELKQIQSVYADSLSSNRYYANWSGMLTSLIQTKHTSSLFIPSIHWYGLNNEYHKWIRKILLGNWGNSTIDNRPAWDKIKEALSWTLSLNLLALFLVYVFALFIGEYLFAHDHSGVSKWLENFLLFFHSIPRFFLAMILIFVFASDNIFPWFHIFPTPGFIDFNPESNLIQKWTVYGSALILPLICMVLPSLAYISRLYANKLFEEKSKPYAFKAWASGMSSKHIIRKHLRKNAVIPILTLIGIEIPSLIGGSVVIEVLFNIPGMGRLMMQSIILQDWVIVFDILLLTGLLTLIGKLSTDIFIRFFDPRIV
ncbi:MAG: ABC transporter permease [Saprospiraceae bacterium]